MDLDGELQPPMANGEVMFEAPWQGRVFGMARVLAERGLYSWDEFRAHLISVIGDWDRSVLMEADGEEYRYYDHFQAALQALLIEKGILAEGSLEGRFSEFLARPSDHDHGHSH
ncbi:MAG: nitrile hydratase accessory protein [Pseudomonadales bacterium]